MSLYKVVEFHRKFKIPILKTPSINLARNLDLRFNWLQEEVDEYEKALNEQDIVGISDALADIQYIHHGNVLEHGLYKIYPLIFNEVHRSNMTKAYSPVKIRKDNPEFSPPNLEQFLQGVLI